MPAPFAALLLADLPALLAVVSVWLVVRALRRADATTRRLLDEEGLPSEADLDTLVTQLRRAPLAPEREGDAT